MPTRPPDPKATEFARSRTLNPHPESVSDETFVASAFFDPRDLVQVKYEMVRKVQTDGASVQGRRGRLRTLASDLLHGGCGARQEWSGRSAAAKPGPRRAHKLTDEVLDYVVELVAADPRVGSRRLADAVRRALRGRGSSTLDRAGPHSPGGRPSPKVADARLDDAETLAVWPWPTRRCERRSSKNNPAAGASATRYSPAGAWRRGWPRGPPSARRPSRRRQRYTFSFLQPPSSYEHPVALPSPPDEQIVDVLTQMALAHV